MQEPGKRPRYSDKIACSVLVVRAQLPSVQECYSFNKDVFVVPAAHAESWQCCV
jgi:hypothetical protein